VRKIVYLNHRLKKTPAHIAIKYYTQLSIDQIKSVLKWYGENYNKYGGVDISGVRIEKKEDLKRYGIADLEHVEGNVSKIKGIVEKPEPDEAPSQIATHGAYILPPEIFGALKRLEPGKGGEIWLVDAINLLRDEGVPVYAVEIENARYFDTGNKLEYMKTAVELALEHPELKDPFTQFLKDLIAKEENR
jgi:UTP--glucose-1-phosphate uridylyltransferase